MKLASIILQIIGFGILASSVTLLMFIQPVTSRGIDGKINKILEFIGIRSIHARERLVYILLLMAVIFGVTGLVMELFI